MMVEKPMMGCGHAANAERAGEPVCAVCIGIRDGADKVVEGPDLTGRTSQCGYCKKIAPSRTSLPFFKFEPGLAHDSHYDGCYGWD